MLDYLDISQTKITNVGLQILTATLTNLSQLNLSRLPQIASNGFFQCLQRLTNLQFLAFDDIALPEEIHLDETVFPNLVHLKANRSNMSDDYLRALVFSNLNIIELSGCLSCTEEGLIGVMDKCPRLVSIAWPSHSLNMDMLLTRVAQLPFENLDLEAHQISNYAVMNLSALRNTYAILIN